MKNNRIIKSIRFYGWISWKDPLYIATKDTIYIWDRIARKLNELDYTYWEYNHLYINPINNLENGILVDWKTYDFPEYKGIRNFNFWLDVNYFNSLDDISKDEIFISITFDLLKKISTQDNLEKVLAVEKLIKSEWKALKIKYKEKETKKYKIIISYQIWANLSPATLVVDYFDLLQWNLHYTFDLPLKYWEHIYYLVDKIIFDDNHILLKPKQSFVATINNQYYTTPIVIDISKKD